MSLTTATSHRHQHRATTTSPQHHPQPAVRAMRSSPLHPPAAHATHHRLQATPLDTTVSHLPMPPVPVACQILQEGLRRTIESYTHLRADVQTKKDGPSKAEILLGRGKVVDTILWRDKKQTRTVILLLAAFYFNFVATGYTVITAISKFLLVASVFIFIQGRLPQKMYTCQPPLYIYANQKCILENMPTRNVYWRTFTLPSIEITCACSK